MIHLQVFNFWPPGKKRKMGGKKLYFGDICIGALKSLFFARCFVSTRS